MNETRFPVGEYMRIPALFSLIAALSIVVIPFSVKTTSAQTPDFNSASKTSLKDSVKETNKQELNELIKVVMEKGFEGTMGANIAPVIGLPGAMPMKAAGIRNVFKGKNRNALNCAVIYKETKGEKIPLCVYLNKRDETRDTVISQYFRISLDGDLEKVVTNRSKKDDSGKQIRGSGTAADDNPNSPAVRKTYETEMKAVKAWLKEQQVAMAKRAPIEKVQTEAEKATTSLEKEAETTPAH